MLRALRRRFSSARGTRRLKTREGGRRGGIAEHPRPGGRLPPARPEVTQRPPGACAPRPEVTQRPPGACAPLGAGRRRFPPAVDLTRPRGVLRPLPGGGSRLSAASTGRPAASALGRAPRGSRAGRRRSIRREEGGTKRRGGVVVKGGGCRLSRKQRRPAAERRRLPRVEKSPSGFLRPLCRRRCCCREGWRGAAGGMEAVPREEKPNPLQDANLCSRLFFW